MKLLASILSVAIFATSVSQASTLVDITETDSEYQVYKDHLCKNGQFYIATGKLSTSEKVARTTADIAKMTALSKGFETTYVSSKEQANIKTNICFVIKKQDDELVYQIKHYIVQ